MKFFHSRGKNDIHFTLTARYFSNKVKQLRSFRASILNTLIYKRPSKPKGFIIYLVYGYSRSTIARYRKRFDMELPKYFYNSEVMPPMFKISPANVMEFTANVVELNYNKWNTHIETAETGLVYNLRKLSIRFIYEDSTKVKGTKKNSI